MSSPVGHSLAGYLCYCFGVKSVFVRSDPLLCAATVVMANFPDLDFLPGFLVGQPNLYHHGISHSVGFALMISFACALLFWKLAKYSFGKSFFLFFLIYCSHLFLDYLAADSRPPAGIPVFWPFSSTYFISPVPILPSVHHSHLTNATIIQVIIDIFSQHNLYVIFLECSIMLPLITLLGIYLRKKTE